MDRHRPVPGFLAGQCDRRGLQHVGSGDRARRDRKSGKHLGREVDVYTWYELNRHVNVGVGVGHFMGGEFLGRTTTGPNYNYPYFAINFKDNGKEAKPRYAWPS